MSFKTPASYDILSFKSPVSSGIPSFKVQRLLASSPMHLLHRPSDDDIPQHVWWFYSPSRGYPQRSCLELFLYRAFPSKSSSGGFLFGMFSQSIINVYQSQNWYVSDPKSMLFWCFLNPQVDMFSTPESMSFSLFPQPRFDILSWFSTHKSMLSLFLTLKSMSLSLPFSTPELSISFPCFLDPPSQCRCI